MAEQEKKLDLRIQRTYRALATSLMELMREKGFDEITVSELCERAMIRRATFYKHFADKYELFTFAIRELQRHFDAQKQHSSAAGCPAFYVAMINDSLEFVERHADVFTSMMNSHSQQVLLDLLSAEIERDILCHLREDQNAGLAMSARPELVAAAMTGALVYTMRWWVQQDLKMPRSEVVKFYTSLFHSL